MLCLKSVYLYKKWKVQVCPLFFCLLGNLFFWPVIRLFTKDRSWRALSRKDEYKSLKVGNSALYCWNFHKWGEYQDILEMVLQNQDFNFCSTLVFIVGKNKKSHKWVEVIDKWHRWLGNGNSRFSFLRLSIIIYTGLTH